MTTPSTFTGLCLTIQLAALFMPVNVVKGDDPCPTPPAQTPCATTFYLDDPRIGPVDNTLWPGRDPLESRWWGLSGTPAASLPGGCASASIVSQCWRHNFWQYGMPSPWFGAVGGVSVQTSTSWAGVVSGSTPQTLGFPLNMSTYSIPRVANLPPLSQSPATSTAPFVSSPVAHSARPLFLADRQLIGGVVDGITGQPLIREVDLELPVGSAHYRFVRTYGGDPWGERDFAVGDNGTYGTIPDNPYYKWPTQATDRQWDWCGTGWMLGENPILLVDAQYMHHDPSLPPRCELILDAHHSIPFTKDLINGTYAAPSWFDALLVRQPPSAPGQPETIVVWLYGRSVKYTFQVSKDDIYLVTNQSAGPNGVPATRLTDAHLPPTVVSNQGRLHSLFPTDTPPSGPQGKGLGVPYYALLTQIDDAYGNRMELSHCAFNKNDHVDWPEAPSCQECVQNCTEKGQLTTAKLITRAGTSNALTEWTLLYVHRSFRNWQSDFCATSPLDPFTNLPVNAGLTPKDKDSAWFNQNALAAVYVFKGDKTLPSRGCWTVPAQWFVQKSPPTDTTWVASIDEQDQWSWDTRFAQALGVSSSVFSDWEYRLRFTYDEVASGFSGGLPPCDQVAASGTILQWGTPVAVWQKTMPVLLRVEKLTRPKPTVSEDQCQRELTGYTYCVDERFGNPLILHGSETISGNTFGEKIPKLRAIYRQAGINKFLERYKSLSPTANSLFSPTCFDAMAARPAWNQTDFSEFAEMAFEWKPLHPATVATSNWALNQLVASGESANAAPLGRIARELLYASGRMGVVSRLTTRGGAGGTDGCYDLQYIEAAPGSHPQTCTMISVPAGQAFHAAYAHNEVGQLDTDCSNTVDVAGPFAKRHPTSFLFPFYWQPLPDSQGEGSLFNERVSPSPLSDPMWIVIADKHPVGVKSYSIADQITDPAAYATAGRPALPDARQIVAFNGPGYVLWSRAWDYKNGGVTANGPTEEFVYESRPSLPQPVLDQDGNPLLDNNGVAMTQSLPNILRMLEHRSLGWGVADLAGQGDGQGLVTTFAYDDRVVGTTTQYTQIIKSTSVKEGRNGSPAKIREFAYVDTANRETPTLSQSFVGPSSSQSAVQERHMKRSYWPADPDLPPDSPNTRVNEEVVWGSGSPLTPGGPDLRPLERRWFDQNGRPVARVYGLVEASDPSSPGWSPGVNDWVFVDLVGYDSDGQKRIEIIDYAAGQSVPVWWQGVGGLSPVSTEMPVPPSTAYARHIPSGAAAMPGTDRLSQPLHLCTGYRHGYRGGVDCVAKPDGHVDFYAQNTWSRYMAGPPIHLVSESASAVFKDCVVAVNGNVTFTSPGQISLAREGELVKTWTVQWKFPSGQPPNVSGGGVPHSGYPDQTKFSTADGVSVALLSSGNQWSIVAEIAPELDDAGRVTKTTFTGKGTNATEPIEQQTEYTDFGLVGKSVAPTGTLTRTVFNPLGQALLEFRGTHDLAEYWQTQGNATGVVNDNLMLTKKFAYGVGVTDIRQLVMTRMFRAKPTVRPQEVVIGTNGQPQNPSTEDSIGWTEHLGYDRRMRQVWTETRSEGVAAGTTGTVVRVRAVWLDNLDRPRFEAVFGPGQAGTSNPSAQPLVSGSTIDPRAMDVYTQPEPTSAQILGYAPQSLTEYRYNARGQVEEQREYDVTLTSGTRYAATRTYFDHADHSYRRIGSDGRVQVMVYNAVNQMVSSITLADHSNSATPNYWEVERVDNQYNRDAQVEVVSHVMRTRESGQLLTTGTAGNAVRADTINWYDDMKRLIATADLGTGSLGDIYANEVDGAGISAVPIPPSQAGSPFAAKPEWSDDNLGWVPPEADPNDWRRFAHITSTAFDVLGRATAVRQSNGTQTVRKYDALNRVVDETVVPAPPEAGGPVDPAIQVRTAYKYERGRLKYIGAVRNGNTGTLSDASWTIHDGAIQVTEMVYGHGPTSTDNTTVPGATVVDATSLTHTPISENYDWLVGVRLPWRKCRVCDYNNDGQISVQDIFDFLTGWFAQASGADFNHDGTISPQDIFDFLACWFNAPPDCDRTYQNSDPAWLDVSFKYSIDGLIVERTERVTQSASNTLKFGYDVLGRRTIVDAATTQSDPNPALRAPNMVDRVEYSYDILDRLSRVTAKSHDLSTQPQTEQSRFIVSDNAFSYDGWGHLLSEQVAHGETLGASARSIDYGWQIRSAPGTTATSFPVFARLQTITYPWAPIPTTTGSPQPRGTLSYNYGTSGSADDLLSRVHRISRIVDAAAVTPVSVPVADFAYAGSGMRLGLTFGPDARGLGVPAIRQSFDADTPAPAPWLPKLDRFGRAKTLAYAADPAGSAVELWRAQYGYDVSGNRTRERLWLGGPGSTADSINGSDRSWVYTYDGMNRLASAASGVVGANGQFLAANQTPAPSPKFMQQWSPDDLGNWAAQLDGSTNTLYGGLKETNYNSAGSVLDQVTSGHKVNVRNELEGVQSQHLDPATGQPSAVSNQTVVYDTLGRMVFDGKRFYQYDLFGRLVQIRASGLVGDSAFNNESGQVIGSLDGLGQLVVHYTYDGLGRMVRAQRPEHPSGTNTVPTTLKVTDTFYDGVRPLQEVVRLAVPLREVTTGPTNSPFFHRLPWQTTAQPTSQNAGTGTPIGSAWALEREYVHAADPGAYADEVLAQLVYQNSSGTPSADAVTLYTLTDENHNVVALADGIGRLAAQYTYLPYGQIRTAELLANAPASPSVPGGVSVPAWSRVLAAARTNRIGHQGLPAERLDTPWADPMGTDGTMPWAYGTGMLGGMAPASYEVVYHSRNRVYAPALGRFVSVDPNGLGMPILDEAVFGGMPIGSSGTGVNIESHVRNGLNAHVAYGMNPLRAVDGLGLSWDPFEMVDEYSAFDIAQKKAFMEAAGSYWAGVGKFGLSLIPIVGSFMAGQEMGARLADGENLGFWDYVTIAAHAAPIVGAVGAEAVGLTRRAMGALFELRATYALRSEGSGPLRVVYDRIRGLIKSGAAICTLCFQSGTLIQGQAVATPIDRISIGDSVRSDVDDSQQSSNISEAQARLLTDGPHVQIHLRVSSISGRTCDIWLLRSVRSMKQMGLNGLIGKAGNVYLPLIHLSGSPTDQGEFAEVVEIEPIATPCLPASGMALVTGRFITTDSQTVEMCFVEGGELLSLTPTHPLWSIDKSGWSAAATFHAGDKIKTRHGLLTVSSICLSNARTTVYNIEVDATHTMFVGTQEIWAHNCSTALRDLVETGGSRLANHSLEEMEGVLNALVREDGFVAGRGSGSTSTRWIKPGAGNEEWIAYVPARAAGSRARQVDQFHNYGQPYWKIHLPGHGELSYPGRIDGGANYLRR